jgi:signal transduction histidine kinase
LAGRNDTATLSIADDGEGFPANPVSQPGVGLSIMNYRADMIGGSLKVQRRSRHYRDLYVPPAKY